MEVNSTVAQYLEVLLNVAFVILPTLAVLAAATPAGKYIGQAIIAFWKWFRSNVDEESDALIKSLAELAGKTPKEVITQFTFNIDKLVAILKEAQPKQG